MEFCHVSNLSPAEHGGMQQQLKKSTMYDVLCSPASSEVQSVPVKHTLLHYCFRSYNSKG